MPYIIKLDAVRAEALADLEAVAAKFEKIGAKADAAKRKMRVPSGPHQRLERAEALVQAMSMPGSGWFGVTSAMRQDAQLQLDKARVAASGRSGRVPPMPPKPPKPPPLPGEEFDRALRDFIGTTRITTNANGMPQVMPLVNRTVGVISKMPAVQQLSAKLGMKPGGLAGAAMLAVTGLIALYRISMSGADKLSMWGRMQSMTGAPASQLGYVGMLGRGAGIDPSQVGGMAEAFGQALRQGGIGSAYFREKGLVDYGPFTVNKVENLQKALEILAKETDRNTRLMVARDTGLAAFLPIIESSTGLRELVKGTAGWMTEQDTQFGRDWQATKAVGSNLFDMWHSRIAQQFLGPVVEGANVLGAAGTGDWRKMGKAYTSYIDSLLSFGTGGFFGADQLTGFRDWRRKKINSMWGDDDKQEKKDAVAAMRDNTRALRDNTEMIKAGPRGVGALPSNWKNIMLEESLKTQAANLGAWQ